jgi:hypothetical protein
VAAGTADLQTPNQRSPIVPQCRTRLRASLICIYHACIAAGAISMALRSTEGIPKPTREPNIRGHNVSPGLIDMSLGGILGQKVRRGRVLSIRGFCCGSPPTLVPFHLHRQSTASDMNSMRPLRRPARAHAGLVPAWQLAAAAVFVVACACVSPALASCSAGTFSNTLACKDLRIRVGAARSAVLLLRDRRLVTRPLRLFFSGFLCCRRQCRS